MGEETKWNKVTFDLENDLILNNVIKGWEFPAFNTKFSSNRRKQQDYLPPPSPCHTVALMCVS